MADSPRDIVQLVPAHMVWRVLAHVIDRILVGVVGFVVSLTLRALGVISESTGSIIAVGVLIYGGIPLLYFTLTEAGGKTAGKSIMDIEVVNQNGRPLSLPAIGWDHPESKGGCWGKEAVGAVRLWRHCPGQQKLLNFPQATAESEAQWEAFLQDLYLRGWKARDLA